MKKSLRQCGICLLLSLLLVAVLSPAAIAADGEVSDSQEVSAASTEEDAPMTGSASTLVTATIAAPTEPDDGGSTPATPAGKDSLAKTGDDTRVTAAYVATFASAGLIALGCAQRRREAGVDSIAKTEPDS